MLLTTEMFLIPDLDNLSPRKEKSNCSQNKLTNGLQSTAAAAAEAAAAATDALGRRHCKCHYRLGKQETQQSSKIPLSLGLGSD